MTFTIVSQVAYLTFGNGVLQPGESTKNAMKDAAEQVIYISVTFLVIALL